MWGLSNENIPPALRLSYYNLPSRLKCCFAYCAIFPKGFLFQKEAIIPLWIAEGFVESEENEEIEITGEKYFNALVSRSFFQQLPYDESYFIMHDLICDLAENVSREFCFKFVEGENSCIPPERARYLSVSNSGGSNLFERIHEVPYLRTILYPRWASWHLECDDKALHDIFTILKRSRMLSFHSCRLSQLPNSIGNLKHLRHLDLSKTSIQRLPEKVSTLYYLQSLLLKECQCLIELPTNTSKLVNLQHLDIEGTDLKEMPSNMGRLNKLRTLPYYIVGKESGSSIKELGKLLHIRKGLSIRSLQNAHVQDALEADLKGKKQVEMLRLTWDGNTDDTQHQRDVLEKLEPYKNVKQLVITRYGGQNFPGWVGNSSFSNMVALTIAGCKNCTSLPPLGRLPSLEELQIKGFDQVVAVGSDLYGSDHLMEKPFRSLKELRFEKMRTWKEWNTDVADAFPHLGKLWIHDCPKLTNALPSHLPSLMNLEILRCPRLAVSFPRAPKLTKIYVEDGTHARIASSGDGQCLYFDEDPQLKGMEQMSHLGSISLTHVDIYNCSSLKCCPLDLLPQICTLTINSCLNLESLNCIRKRPLLALHRLKIINCPNLVSFPEGRFAAPNLRCLDLVDCLQLKPLPENMHSLLPSLEDLVLNSLPQIDSFPHLPSIELLGIRNLESLYCIGLQHFTSLSSLTIESCPKLESVPEQGLPSSLECLHFWNLKSLGHIGLLHLTCLRTLTIQSCPKLKSMPEQGLPASLDYLEIYSCPLLAKTCEKETGEDWPKISHISLIEIYD